MKRNKAQGLPINVVVMLIIGVMIFGLGMGLFSKVSKSSEIQIEDLNSQVKTGIASLECGGNDWICSPSYRMKKGESKTFEIFIANHGNDAGNFEIYFPNLDEGDITNDCGTVSIFYPNIDVNIRSGESAQLPFIVRANKVAKSGCSFITTVELLDNTNTEIDRTSVIIRVE